MSPRTYAGAFDGPDAVDLARSWSGAVGCTVAPDGTPDLAPLGRRVPLADAWGDELGVLAGR
jgi:hypothetical protein